MKLIKDLGLMYPKPSSKQKKRYGIYECPLCKKRVEAQSYKVKGGQSQCNSCARRLGRKHQTHGMTGKRLFVIHVNMIQRCYNPNHKSYPNYGGRGITVCEEWQENPAAFFEWAESHGYQDDLTIDRKDPDKGYSPSNCRFVDRKAQAQNRRKQEGTLYNYIGLRFLEGSKRYEARVMVNGKRHSVGIYLTEIEAAVARDRFIIDNDFQHCRLNILKRDN